MTGGILQIIKQCSAVHMSKQGHTPYNPDIGIILLSPDSLNFYMSLGDANPQAQSILLRNAGGSTIKWELPGECPWLLISQTQGQLAPGQTTALTINVEAFELDRGLHTHEIQIVTTNTLKSWHTVEVKLMISGILYVPAEFETIQDALNAYGNTRNYVIRGYGSDYPYQGPVICGKPYIYLVGEEGENKAYIDGSVDLAHSSKLENINLIGDENLPAEIRIGNRCQIVDCDMFDKNGDPNKRGDVTTGDFCLLSGCSVGSIVLGYCCKVVDRWW